MKPIFSLLLAMLITTLSIAQTPYKMSYQAVIRDTEGNLVAEQEIGMQISILQGSANGAAVYVETHTSTTNANGLVSIEIGGDDATAVSGNFALIDWSAGPHFIKTETDPSGGTNYTITGTSQLLSVPYALHSGSSEVLTGEITESQISDLKNYLTEEADPLFDASPAAGIEAADIGNWNEAFEWGDHAEENYLISEKDPIFTSTFDFEDVEDGDLLRYDATAGKWIRFTPDYLSEYIEADPVFEASPAADIEADDIDNWDEAYGWGNHAAQGYLTEESQDLADVLSHGDDADGNQIKNLADPTDAEDAATKAYVDESAPTTYEIGDFAHGGIVFWVDETGQHGLVCAKTDQSTGVRWWAGDYTWTMALGDGPMAGKMNTAIIIANQGRGDGPNYAARVCNELQVTEGGKTYGDWYLPSKEELNLMYQNKAAIDSTADRNGGRYFDRSTYWSSTEYNDLHPWTQDFNDGSQNRLLYKRHEYRVRAVRSF